MTDTKEQKIETAKILIINDNHGHGFKLKNIPKISDTNNTSSVTKGSEDMYDDDTHWGRMYY